MFTGIIETILLHHVGKYLNGLDKNSFNVGLIDGEITIENIGLNNTLFDELEIPLTLKFSNIQRIHIEVPWTKLDEKATVVTIQGITILLDLSELKSLTESTIAFKFQQIISKIKKELEEKEEKDKEKKDKKKEGFAERSLIRILDNVDLTLRNLHVRFQDNSSFKSHRFSFGVVIKELIFHTANKDGNKVFYKRNFSKGVQNPPVYRELKATEVKAYWNSDEVVFVKDIVESGAQRDHILQFMRMPFPQTRQDIVSPTKKEKDGDFLKDLFKSKGEKQKQKEKIQKDKIRYEQYKKQMGRMRFTNILDLILTVETSQNDLNDKENPLFQAKVWVQPVKVEVGEVMISQLLCLLEYYLKYTQDLFYYENKTKTGGMGNSFKHQKIFNDVMQELFKKLPKIKSLSEIPKQTFKAKEDQDLFFEILDLQSVKNLRTFANDFVSEMKLKKQIEKAEKNIKKKQKATEDIQKLMEKTKLTEGEFQEVEIDYKGRVLIDLDCEIGGVSVKINQEKDNSVTESIRLILPLTKFFLNFVNENNFTSQITSKDLLLDYSTLHKYLDLHANQHDNFINIEFKKQGKAMNLNAKIQKKQFTFPESLIAFVIKFIEPVHITPFFLNLFQQSTNIDSEAARSIIDGLMSVVPNMVARIEVDLPKVEIQLKSTGIIVDCGRLTVDIPKEGCYQIPLKLQGLNIELVNGDVRTQFIPEISTQINFLREFRETQHQDSITFDFDRVEVVVPEVSIFDKLTTEIFQLTKDILKKQLHLIDRKRSQLSEKVWLNSAPSPHTLYLLGQMLEISSTPPQYIILYQTVAYPLSFKNKYYIVLLKKRRVNYLEVSSEKEMNSLIELLNEHIESLSTINQLKNIWHINSRYESNGELISKDADKLMTFICQSGSSEVLLSQVDVHVNVGSLIAKFSDITIDAQIIRYHHVEYNQMGEDKLSVKNVSVSIKEEKFITGIDSNQPFLELSSTLIISQRLDISFCSVALSLTHENVSPLVQSVHQILKTTILREALTFNTEVKNHHCRELFNIIQLQSSIRIKQLQCSIMECAGFIAQKIQIKSKIESNSQEVLLLIQGMDVFEMMKFSEFQLRRIQMIDLQNILEIKYKSLLVEMSPELLVRYLAILESNKQSILSHYETILNVLKFIKQSSYLSNNTQTNEKISVIGSNIQVQLVESEENILQVLVHEFMFQFNTCNTLNNYILSLMEVSINQQKSNSAIPIIKNFSVILKSYLKNSRNNISLAVTKLEVMIGIYILEYLYKVAKSLHTVFLRNQWVLKFITHLSKDDPQLNPIITQLQPPQISINLQLDEIGILYIKNDNIPYLKLKLKINQSVLDIGKEIGLQVGVNLSLLYFNNAIKIFEPIIEPVEFQTSYSKSPRLQSLKVSTKILRVNISNEAISETISSVKQLRQFSRKHQDSFQEILNTITRIKQNKSLIIQKEQSRRRSPSKNKQDFTKGFTIRNFKQPRSIQPSNHLSIINLSGSPISINLLGNKMDLHADLPNKTQQIIPIKIKSEYKHNYEILERVRCFKIIISIDKHEREVNFSISKIVNERIELEEGRYIRLKAVIDNEGMSVFVVGRIKVVNSTPQKMIVKVGVDFEEEILENSEIYLPYYTEEEFKLSMVSSSGVSIPISNKEAFQELEFVTFSSDHHTILLTSQINNDEITYRLMDSMRIFNHFDFKLEFKLGDTGLTLPPNSITSTSKTSLTQIKTVELNIPSIGKWISIPINKLSTSERQLDYPLEKQQIKIYIILFKSKMGRLIHIYPRLSITNLTPYKLTLYTSLYESLFLVNKRLSEQRDQKHEPQHVKGYTIDYKEEGDCFVLDQERYLHLSFANHKEKSEEFIGYDSDFNRTVDIRDEKYLYKIKVTYDSSFLTEEISIFKATLKPKLYFVNRSDHEIKVYDWIIKPNHLIPFAFPISTPALSLSLDYEGITHSLINQVELSHESRWNLLLVEEGKGKEKSEVFEDFEVLRFGIELIFKQGFGYYVFSRNTEYVVINNTFLENRRLVIVDDTEIQIRYEIPTGQRRKYYYRSETITIQVLGEENELIEDVVLNLNEISNNDLETCSISTYFQHLDRIITFSDVTEESITFFNEEHGKPQRMLSLGIDEITVSAIFYNFDDIRCQTLFLKITQTNILQIDYQKILMLQLKSKNLTLISKQINQINQILSKQSSSKQFFNLYVQIPKERNIILSFKLDISPIRLCMSDQLLQLILFNIDKLGLFNQPNTQETNKQFQIFFEFYNKTREEKVGDKMLWKVVSLTIKEIEFEVEFKKCFVKGNRERMKSFGFSLAELKANKLSLSKLEIHNSEQSISDFGRAILSQYKKEIVSIVGGVLGGLNIIGNPREFVLQIQSSLNQSNPGIIRGTGGFFRGVAVGTVNSASKITGVVGNGLSLLSLDEKYLEERQMIKNRSITSAGDGLKAGGSALFKGLESGFTGLVTQPVRGLQEQGFFGIFKGSLKGVVGFFTKPVVGALDAASMTTQGLASISKSSKHQQTFHQRIRPLYYQRRIIRPQCDVQQTCCLFLAKYMPQYYNEMKLVQTFLLQQEQDPETLTSVLVLSLTELMVIDILSKEIVLRIKNEDMSAVAKFTQGAVLYYLQDQEEVQVILRLKRSNELKHLLQLSIQKVIETFRVIQ